MMNAECLNKVFAWGLLILLTLSVSLKAQFRPYDSNRIAISGDGNSAPDYKHKWPTGDPDDWGAVPAILATLAKVELQDQLVHFSYNNFIEAPSGPDADNQMKIGADGSIERWNYNGSRFFDITTALEEATQQLKLEIEKSSESDPLYFIHMGLSEFFYQVVKQVVDGGNGDALAHVYIVSHSGFNDSHLRRDNHHTIFEAIEYSGGLLNYHKIKDQNGKENPDLLWNSLDDFSPWYWMRDHPDRDVQWIYKRMLVHSGGVADISDTGMLYWLLKGDEDGSPSKFKDFIGGGILRDYQAWKENQLEKQRLMILADMGNEPDEMQQMIHMITCSNEFDIEGLVAVTGKYIHPDRSEAYNQVTHPELFHQIIDAYAGVVDNLQLHADGWPRPDYLKRIVAAGQKGYGTGDIGPGKSSPGSELIIQALTREDDRPLWIVVNAGSNTLAQALIDYREAHSKEETEAFVAKLRVFENGAQDNAGAWICSQYPKIHWIRSNYQTYAYGGPGGKDGDLTTNLGPNYWHPYESSVEGQLKWQKEHIMNDHGALGDLYPERRYHGFMDGGLGFMEGGGTIPWMGLVNKGLFDINQPSWGGWGGRFSQKKTADFWSRHGDIKVDEEKVAPFYTHREVSDFWTDPQDGWVYYDDYVPVWRWREAMFNNQSCRMDWSVKSFEDANHQPVAAFHKNKSNSVIRLNASAGEEVKLDASQSTDPDGDPLSYSWWIYEEAGSYAGNIHIPDPTSPSTSMKIPTGAGGTQIHLILEIKDKSHIAPLFDYRRIVINVDEVVVGHESVQDQ